MSLREPLCIVGAVLCYMALLSCLLWRAPAGVPWALGVAAVALVAVRK